MIFCYKYLVFFLIMIEFHMKKTPKDLQKFQNKFFVFMTIVFSLFNAASYMLDNYLSMFFSSFLYLVIIATIKNYFGIRDVLFASKLF